MFPRTGEERASSCRLDLKMRRLLAAASLCAVLAFAGGATAADDPYAALLAPSGTCGAADEQLNLDPLAAQAAMTCLTNYARAQSGLKPLQPSATLDAAGDAKLGADVSCGEFSHEPCGKPFDSVFAAYVQGATSFQIGENIAWGTGAYGTPRQIMSAWLHSTGHRENILTPGFTELGVGYIASADFLGYTGAALWSQEFGTRSPAAAPSAATNAAKTKQPGVKRKASTHKRRPKLHRP